MMKRANQQESLAERQRQQLAQLRTMQQDQQLKEREYLQRQRDAERAELAKKYAEKERLLAEQEKKYRGRYNQIRNRASDLDVNNRDLHAELARSEKQQNVLRDEVGLLKRRLDDTTRQLSQTKSVSQETGRRLQALQASASQRRGNAAIRANSSIQRPITAVMVPGMDIRQDGDLVRISIPSEQLFMGGTARLHQGSTAYMDQVANILQQYYPQQIAGVEAHTDQSATSISQSEWRNHHQLTAAQAMSVFEQLTTRRISPNQLFVLGYGGNHPRVSGGTSEGQTMNRRVEIVIYPEMVGT